MEAVQPTFDDLGRPLSDVTFCVVDLETTGGSPKGGSKITEVGAVKVRGGEVLGEFQTLVNPDETIPAFITVLTGITDAMVIDKPAHRRGAAELPGVRARHACWWRTTPRSTPGSSSTTARELGIPWPRFDVLDTAVLARRILLRDEVPNCKLATLARVFPPPPRPNHRALSDARATVDVLHGLFERLGPLGVTRSRRSPRSRRGSRRPSARSATWPSTSAQAPGVYLFRDARDDVLYVGTSRELRARVRSLLHRVRDPHPHGRDGHAGPAGRVGIVCATTLEAQVRELRLIARHRPPYNRRSKFPDRLSWLKLTREPWPRLSVVKRILDDDADYIGPFGSRSSAEDAMAALHDTFRIRQCTPKLAKRSAPPACALAELGHCLSPCDGSVEPEAYAPRCSGCSAP